MFFRAVSRAVTSSARNSTRTAVYARQFSQQQIRCAAASEHAIANPELAGIEKRWDVMPPQEQAELWMKLRDRMKVNWKDMTLAEKKAAYWIAFGPHGPRAETPKGEGLRLIVQTAKYLAITAGFWVVIRYFGGPAPSTMTKEWQEATNEYAKREKMDPLTGISSEGYTGKGHVQSDPAKQ